MKIRCDGCDKEQASVFCSADEAALCDGCDRRVHHANKLASKHMRFSLVSPSFKESPLCDICQKRRALLFCQEDRAILCRECDLPIHKANEYTKKHSRFLLTGVKLSASSSLYPSSSSSSDCCDAKAPGENRISHSSGWRVEDLLDPSSDVFCKTSDQFLSFGDQDRERNYLGYFSSEDLAIWVPEVSPQSSPDQVPLYCPQSGSINGSKESTTAANNSLKAGRKLSDDGFTVPQISPPSLKKTRYSH